MTCEIAPCTVKSAKLKVSEWHRHLKDIQGGLFAAQCLDPDGNCVGVAIAGNPSRVWQGQAKLVISRVATQGHENACSALYGALCRAAKALGYREVWTYTLPHEPGTSLRAAGIPKHATVIVWLGCILQESGDIGINGHDALSASAGCFIPHNEAGAVFPIA